MPRPHFHKLILSNTIRENRLRIPDNFVKKFGHELSAVVGLTVPDGHVWRVGLLKADDKLWFHDGWQKFAERYSIRVGYFLVFRYEGNALFNVHIFNLCASEINYQSNLLIGKRYLPFEEMEEEDSVENMVSKVFDEHADRYTVSRIYNTSPHQSLTNESKLNNFWPGEGNSHLSKGANLSQSTNESKDVGVQFNAIEVKNSVDGVKFYTPDVGMPKAKKSGRKRKIDSNELRTTVQRTDEMRSRFYESASARKRTVTAEERERATNAAKAFEPVNPFFRVVLRPSYLYKGCIMYVPSCFAEKHLNGVSGFIKLQLSDSKQWSVRCLYKGGRAKLTQGWYEFTLENNLGEGDVCVFELLRSRDFVLKVTVFRISESHGFISRP